MKTRKWQVSFEIACTNSFPTVTFLKSFFKNMFTGKYTKVKNLKVTRVE